MIEKTTAEKPHALYRFFDPEGVLLYVGITNNPARRFAQHGAARDWWYEVDTIRMERFPDRESVLLAEREAIQAERPRYNVVHANGAAPEQPSPTQAPSDYPVTAGEVVALALAPNHLAETECPVGLVTEVSRFGVKVARMSWLSGYFDQGEALIAWSRVMEIQWASTMTPAQAEKDGYGRVEGIWDCDKLGDFQIEWTKGRQAMLDHRRSMLEMNRR